MSLRTKKDPFLTEQKNLLKRINKYMWHNSLGLGQLLSISYAFLMLKTITNALFFFFFFLVFPKLDGDCCFIIREC